MGSLLTAPERLAYMLVDSNPNIVAAYYTYIHNLDMIERPSYIIGSGEASYSVTQETSLNQASVEEDYEIAFVGEHFKGTEEDFGHEFEFQARQAANDAVLYLLRHANMQFSNTRGLQPSALPALEGIKWIRPTRRSRVTLMTREGIEASFWGFTIGLSVRSILLDDEDEIYISGF